MRVISQRFIVTIYYFSILEADSYRQIFGMTGVSRKRARPASATTKSNVKAKSRKLMKQTATPDKKITDFFPIRKSNRITGKALEVRLLWIAFHNSLRI